MNKHKPFLECKFRQKINELFLADEEVVVKELVSFAELDPTTLQNIQYRASDLVENVRNSSGQKGTIEAFIQEYDLSTEEGTVLMCLAEALLRIPDDETADKLIKDKIAPAKWQQHLGHSPSLFVNTSTWGLMLGGKILKSYNDDLTPWEIVNRIIIRLGEPLVRTVLKQAMKIMGSQFVMGININSASDRSQKQFHKNYRFSFDMLGEAALCTKDADKYFNEYLIALNALADQRSNYHDIFLAPGLSIKLSALHPRYELSQYSRVMEELVPKVLSLAQLAKNADVSVTIDAEEADRLDLSLDIFASVINNPSIKGWNGFGLAVQAYQKRAYAVLHWLKNIASESGNKIPVRLVKGAYWDTEIKRAQEKGLISYPVFTRKVNTDISYNACAKFLLGNPENFYPQFATHNACTLATIIEIAGSNTDFEFQRLHGMGEQLYQQVIAQFPCRVYAPVGSYKDLLPYLVRRLLENGANTSFVNRIENRNIALEKIIEDPVTKLQREKLYFNSNIPLPGKLYGKERYNSAGINTADYLELQMLLDKISLGKKFWQSTPVIDDYKPNVYVNEVFSPFLSEAIGTTSYSDEKAIEVCLQQAHENSHHWRKSTIQERTNVINSFANLLQHHADELYSLCVYEAGKTINDAIAEVREAIDFCYYYISQANKLIGQTNKLPGPTGEDNTLQLHGRGIFVCISPWNFPLAIYIGQIVAAYITGNIVIAKPSSNTTLIAYFAFQLLLKAGATKKSIYFLPCKSNLFESLVLNDARIAGVAFTGSLDAAWKINRTLAQRNTAIAPLIAETGGQNAMIVDSSALAEQVVKDVITSAFYSSGQRCSALRILIIQKDVLGNIVALLQEAMKELVIGHPDYYSTDIPPVIDQNAKLKLIAYKNQMQLKGKQLFELKLPENINGCYVAPCLFAIDRLSELESEQFGPYLHIMSYEHNELEQIIDDINRLGFGLTLGIHSRINETINFISANANVGNIYVNRNMVGAVVGTQPFGGEGLSGTGPKAGGPNYLQRFCAEKTVSINTSAIGGNTKLLSLSDS